MNKIIITIDPGAKYNQLDWEVPINVPIRDIIDKLIELNSWEEYAESYFLTRKSDDSLLDTTMSFHDQDVYTGDVIQISSNRPAVAPISGPEAAATSGQQEAATIKLKKIQIDD